MSIHTSSACASRSFAFANAFLSQSTCMNNVTPSLRSPARTVASVSSITAGAGAGAGAGANTVRMTTTATRKASVNGNGIGNGGSMSMSSMSTSSMGMGNMNMNMGSLSNMNAMASSRSASSSTPALASTSSFSTDAEADVPNNNKLSSARGRKAVSLLPVYLTDARAVIKYHPVDAPNGALQLSVAENQMLEDLLVPALKKFSTEKSQSDSHEDGTCMTDEMAGLFHSDQIYYQPTHGREGLRTAFANYLHRILKLGGKNTNTGRSLDVEGLVLGAGCNAVLENLCFTLTEPGDAVLLPTPYYAAFEFDLVARANLNIVPIHTIQHSGIDIAIEHTDTSFRMNSTIPKEAYYPNRASLNAAYRQALNSGSTPKILLLSHPNNPLGICYPPEVIKECIDWAREKEVHLVSDEIYAGSVYELQDDLGEDYFHSALALASDYEENKSGEGLGLGPYVHFVYALSKDFALSGLRVGVAYSENEEIRLPLQKLNDLCQISSQTQLTVQNMLAAEAEGMAEGDLNLWSTDEFLPRNHDRIRNRSHQLQACLDECRIPYLPGDSGLFLWMDFSQFLAEAEESEASESVSGLNESQEGMDKRERALYLELMQEFGLLFTPGRSMRNELPGFFRCVFTAASDDEFALGLKRIREFVVSKQG
eukprot:CAMPEP_0194095786 /NCGR_PEP_ID=MMETSP0149-20130528/57008_1 /TAXON_ID=122233 /ORGANISM="Chaetoceros debilis, Strain MM31A-1" /LENGTH=652 /DNA_ID=CAMNT_0038781743 /DNA_START=716 /DNA_END=2674 /DNA_ORIENTATION=-